MNVEVIKESLPDGFRAGSGTVGTTEAKISTINWPVRKHIVIRANAANSNVIEVGPAGHAADGFILAAGETSPPMYVEETDAIGIIGGAASQAYSWMAH